MIALELLPLKLWELQMDSEALAKYLEQTDSISKPWLLAQLRLKKLAERRGEMTAEAYEAAIADLHQDVMNLGEWWVGIEDKEFGDR
ncbi:MAG: hypothetical protein MUF49_18575 [Oculatellaceae cyanobacterium Prado106]|jgi:hypothetical protein|nr:hypothetical protein [Oculatellaceae cyanobacterium Prado106]